MLKDCPGVVPYVHDILVYGKMHVEHDWRLECALHCLNTKNFRLQLSKCKFHQPDVSFLGHILSGTELCPRLSMVEAIANAPTPSNVQQLTSFLGLITYCSDFIEDLATVAEPLPALQRKGATFNWSKECQEAFEWIKQMISCNLKLALYDPNADTYLTTNASGVGISTMLLQKQDGHEVIITCRSHMLQPVARNYSTLEPEAYAIVWGMESLGKFLWGRLFTICTDHRALQFLFQGPAKAEQTCRSSKLVRWAERLSVFDYTVEHVKGTDNKFADMLSCLPMQSNKAALPEVTQDCTLKWIVAEGIMLSKLQTATKDNSVLGQIIPVVNGHWPHKSQVPTGLLLYYHVRGDLHVEDGCLAREAQFVAPASLHSQILQQAHLGHPGMKRLL